MEYVSTAKEIRKTFTNVKFWAISMRKKRCEELVVKIKEALKTLKEMLARFLAVGASLEERREAMEIRKEIAEIETLI